MRAVLEGFKIDCLWHFTDKKNYGSICEHGLLSWKELNRRGLAPPAPGGNDWSHSADERFGVDDYVHLSFSRKHPMLYVAQKDGRITNPLWLKIDLSVLDGREVRFTNAVSNKSGVELLENDAAKKVVDFTGLFTYLDFSIEGNKERRSAAEKSEVLVLNMISPDKILGCVNG
jgi:hypothetical protein